MAKRNKAPTAPAPIVNDAPLAPSADMAIIGDNGAWIDAALAPHTPDDATTDDATPSIPVPPDAALSAPPVVKASRLRQTTIDAMRLAAQGNIPAAPDFTKPTHAGYRKRLAALVSAVDAGDVGPLLADKTQPVSSSRIMLCRYRDNALAALLARQAKAETDTVAA